MFKVWRETEDVTVHLEKHPEHTDSVFVHLTLRRWSVSVSCQLTLWLGELLKELKEQGIAYLFAYNKQQDLKWKKFVGLYGFSWAFKSPEGLDVYVRKVE